MVIKRKFVPQLLCVALAMILVLMLVPSAALAASMDVTYIDETGTEHTVNATTVTSATSSLGTGWYVVNSDVTRSSSITVSGAANLILTDGKTLTVAAASGTQNAGIIVQGAASLTIYGQSNGTGILNATGSYYGAGIGGSGYTSEISCGIITINSGTVNAYGGDVAAGIGSGFYGGGDGRITINGGTVSAYGGDNGAGIGGGLSGSGGNITITGGNITANGGECGAGIGSGGTAGGDSSTSGGSINISGGTIAATGGIYGAGIGGGIYASGGNINISGGNITAATRDNSWGGTGIGGGFDRGGGNITISGGTITATGETCGAGIGGSGSGDGGSIAISGGIVKAIGDNSVWGGSPGIGCGTYGNGVTITLSGGLIFAQGGPGAKDVGGGADSTNHGTLEILNTAALFLRNNSCVTPATTTHTRETITAHIANAAVYGIPVQWSGNFGAYLRLYTLAYNLNNGSGIVPQQVTKHIGNSATVANSASSRTGYTISGWNTAADGGGTSYTAGDTFTFLSSTTLYAAWLPHTYTINYNANGGSGSTASSSHTYGVSKALTVNSFTRTGYSFAGWATSIGGAIVYSDGQNVSNLISANGATVTLYAKWTPHTCTVIYNASGGSGSTASGVHTYGIAKTLTPNGFTRTGYTFAGWATSTGGSVVYSNGHNVTNLTPVNGATLTLYAVWTTNTYTVSYNANGGSGSTVSGSHTYDAAKALTVNGFTRTGFTFAGWAASAGGAAAYSDGQNVLNLTAVKNATVSLYAVWTPHTCTVDYNANGGSGSTDSSSHTYGVAITLTANGFTKTGYTFAGWAISAGGAVIYSDGQNVVNLTAVNGATITLYAVWTTNSYTINYNANGGLSITASGSHTYDEAKTLTANDFTRTGYTFAGWAASADGTAIYTDEESVLNLASEDGAIVTLYAVWTPHACTVSYSANGGSGSTDSSSHIYDAWKTLTANGFAKTGYTFAGWATSVDGSVNFADCQSVLNLTSEEGAIVTLYAVWTTNSYTVNYNPNCGSGSTASSSHSYDETKKLTPNGFTRTGYTFAGWAANTDSAVVYTDIESVFNLASEDDKTLTLYAVWTPHTYMASYNPNGGSGSTTSSSHTFDEIKSLTVSGFMRSGYTFAGWAAETDGTVIYLDGQSILNLTAEDGATLTLYAVWTTNSYAVSYNTNGGSGSTTLSRHTYDVAKALTANSFTRSGYIFAGWAISPDGAAVYADGQNIVNLTAENGATITLYAAWTPVYSLTVVSGSGSGSFEAKTRVDIAADAAPSGKVFDKWTSSGGGTFENASSTRTTFKMPDENVSVTAEYREVIATPAPTAGEATPTPTPTAAAVVMLTQFSVQEDESAGLIVVTINSDDLPDGITAIKLPSGENTQIYTAQKMLQLRIRQSDLNDLGVLEIIALDKDKLPLGKYQIDLSNFVWQEGAAQRGSDYSMLFWLAMAVLIIGAASAVILMKFKKKQ